MATELKPYPAYKDSGEEWLGDVPTHWKTKRLKSRILDIIDPASERRPSEIYIALEHVEGWTGKIVHIDYDTVFESQVKSFQSNDVLFGKLRPYLAKTTYPRRSGVCVGEFLVLRPRENNPLPGYLDLWLRSKPVIDVISASTFGAKMPRANWQFIGNMSLLFPPLSEQTAIVRFLGHADRRIRRYIRAKEKLIALLEEQKQAIIHQAVTGQTDVRTGQPYPAYKLSDVEWLGGVPQHWEQRRLRAVAKITTGGQDTINRQDGGKYPFFVRSQTVERINTWSFDGEAVLTAGDGVGVGKVFHYVNGKFDFHQRVYKFSNFDAVLGKFFFHYFKALLGFEVLQGTAKSTVDSLRLPMLQNFPVAIPPPAEQTALIENIERITAETEAATSHARHHIELLREYRTRLIADVVTGKLDVREVAARLPEVDPLAADDALDGGNATDDGLDLESGIVVAERSDGEGLNNREAQA